MNRNHQRGQYLDTNYLGDVIYARQPFCRRLNESWLKTRAVFSRCHRYFMILDTLDNCAVFGNRYHLRGVVANLK